MKVVYLIKRGLQQLVPGRFRPHWMDCYYDIRKGLDFRIMKWMSKPFLLNGMPYQYFAHPYSRTFYTERCVEVAVAVALWLLDQYAGKRVLEIGNVTRNYRHGGHVVVDKYEIAPDVINEDILDYQPVLKFDLILSISTFEHIGQQNTSGAESPSFEGPDPILRAIDRVKAFLAPGGLFFISMPIGFNPYVDQQIESGGLGLNESWFMKRTSRHSTWHQVPYDDVRGCPYNWKNCCADALCFGRYVKPSAGEPEQTPGGRRTLEDDRAAAGLGGADYLAAPG